MDIESAHQARRDKESSARQKQRNQEIVETTIAGIIIVFIVVGLVWGTYELVQYCKYVQCGK
jgi:hypothetical protein